MVTPPTSSHSPYAAASPLNLPSSATRSAVASGHSGPSGHPAHDTSMLFIGQACHLSSCRREDFLPFHCRNCGNKYCAEHYQPSGANGHSCSYSLHPERASNGEQGDFLVPLCPLCEKPPAGWKRGEDPTLVMQQHLDFGGCPVLNQAADEEAKRRKKANQCSERRCAKMIVVRIECEKCRDVFCPSHRAPNQHDCRALHSASQGTGAANRGGDPSTRSAAGLAAGLAAMKRLAITAENSMSGTPSTKTSGKSHASPTPQPTARLNTKSSSTTAEETEKSTEKDSAQSSNKGSKNLFGAKLAERTTDKRTKSERLSQLRALQSRRSKGLKLSEAEQLRLAELMREFKSKGAADEGIQGDHRSWKGAGGIGMGMRSSALGKKEKGEKEGDNCVVC